MTMRARWRQRRPGADPLIEEAWEHRRRRRQRAFVVAGCAVILAIGVFVVRNGPAHSVSLVRAGSTQPISAPSFAHPCGLLTNLQVARAVDSTFAYRIPHPGKIATACFWYFAPLSNFTSARSALFLMVSRTTMTRFRKFTPFGVVPIARLGERAYWTPNSSVRRLVVFDHGYSVTLYASEVKDALAVEKALAPLVLRRLR